jgi:hypothetical protein
MLSQFNILFSLPTFVFIALHIVIIIFANRIYKVNSYKYGLLLMVFAILALINNLISVIVQITDLYYYLVIVSGLPYSIASMIMSSLNFVSISLNLAGMILLVVAVTKIFKTHETNRTE